MPPADSGHVTAETAVVLPVLLVVLAAALWVLAAVGDQLRCTDAAAVGARAAARGEALPVVRQATRAAAPPGAQVEVTTGADTVEVTVRAQVRPVGGALAALPAAHVSGRAVAAREDVLTADVAAVPGVGTPAQAGVAPEVPRGQAAVPARSP